MASHLAAIFGTEQDRVNCSFYYKIGACRHGDRCSRKHQRPLHSQTILLCNVYHNPGIDTSTPQGQAELQTDFDRFYEDMYIELCSFGNVLEMHVCDNVGDHLVGNVYARYEWEVEAQNAVTSLNDRWYGGKPLFGELSPVTDFREACCRQNETGDCNRGGLCNFLHVRNPTKALLNDLRAGQRLERKLNGPKSTVQETVGWVPGGGGSSSPAKDLIPEDDQGWRSSGAGRERSRSPARRNGGRGADDGEFEDQPFGRKY